jgi:hypothetical protein
MKFNKIGDNIKFFKIKIIIIINKFFNKIIIVIIKMGFGTRLECQNL